jgi:hypothetical protein
MQDLVRQQLTRLYGSVWNVSELLNTFEVISSCIHRTTWVRRRVDGILGTVTLDSFDLYHSFDCNGADRGILVNDALDDQSLVTGDCP